MPCHSYQPSEEQIQIGKIKRELDDVTRLLCSTLHQIEKSGAPILETSTKLETFLSSDPDIFLPPELLEIEGLQKWWTHHKRWDMIRAIRQAEHEKLLKKQAVATSALNKLTDEEKTALGL